MVMLLLYSYCCINTLFIFSSTYNSIIIHSCVVNMSAADELLVWCTDGDDIHVKHSLTNSKKPDFKVKQAALLAAVINGHHKVVEVLLNFDTDVNCRSHNQSNYTPLHFAASKGYLNCAKVLLKHHADITAKDALGNTPTDLAKRNAKTAVAKLLMSEGIN